MRPDSEALLNNAVRAIHLAEPDATTLSSSATRVADRLGISEPAKLHLAAIENCAGVQQSLTAYRAKTLSSSRAILIQAHLHDCFECHRAYAAGTGSAALDWSAPRIARSAPWNLRIFGWAMVPAFTALLVTFFVYRAFWLVPPGVRAEVVSVDGSAYRTSDAVDHLLTVGDKLNEGDHLRTTGGAHAVLRLADGSSVEVNERSLLGVKARGKDITVAVDNGAVIVQAAKRTSGHLYVKTPDCRVAVTGTIFSVNAGIKGSRVAVLEGTVHVTHSGVDTMINAGDQLSTNVNLGAQPVEQQIAWSRDLDKYLPLLAQFSILEHRIDQIASPQLRYTSDLLPRVPVNTLFYVSIPNLGNFLNDANNIFHDQLKQSPALQQWWSSGSPQKTEEVDALIEKLRQVSEFLGDEVVLLGAQHPDGLKADATFAVLADVQKSGLANLLKQQSPLPGSPAIVVLNEASLADAADTTGPPSLYALVRSHEVVFTNSIVTLKQLNVQLNASSSGFATQDFGKQIAAAYARGAGMILAADLHQMLHTASGSALAGQSRQNALSASGMEDVRYLIAEHRVSNGQPLNHVNLQFSGTRQGVPSWLAAPAPIGSLDFVSPNASIAVAFLSKDPATIADDILKMAQPEVAAENNGWSDAQKKLQIDVRNDLAANLGGDFLLSLDGAVLPTPAWKAVIEVRNAGQLEKSLERLVDAVRSQNATGLGTPVVTQGENHAQPHDIAIQSEQSGNAVFYTVRDLTSGATLAQYTFADGYMILSPDRALLLQALHAHQSGNSLAHSSAFKTLLPRDENANYSAIAYQNIGPVLTPLLAHLSGQAAEAVTQLAADGRPTAICVWGKDDRIEAESDSKLLGFDLLALGALVHPDQSQATRGNMQASRSVQQ